ncbi:MAG: type 2 isopentenyl-diphosphate Delta-isomerase [Spirochaetia bacterium]|nr:type 2 isopentenyl-diphosphate Delta-isomerase [Spirochaetia bacterium]
MSHIENRKINHIEKTLSDPDIDRKSSGFDKIRLRHHALPELDFDAVDTSTIFLGKKLSFPFMISSITGGSSPEIIRINRNLAIAAQKTGVALAVGSERIIFSDKEAEESFRLRDLAPDVPLIGNLGAVQLNYGFGISECEKAVEILGGDALFLHLNPLQEIIQTGGNRNFSGLAEKIAVINRKLSVPLMIKETGCGLCSDDFRLLINCGIRYIDISGRGGTSWSRIEYLCSDDCDSQGLEFQDWGLTVCESLKEAAEYRDRLCLIAGGGIRSGTDIAKAMVSGARMGAASLPFLKAATESADQVIRLIENMRMQFRIAMFLLGKDAPQKLVNDNSLIKVD